jgi:molybdopterin-guanine dinucleotide biosynthesis protein A
MNGLVIAGGKSTRMQQDKAMLQYHRMPQYQYVYNMLQSFCSETFISLHTENNNIPLPKIIDNPIYSNAGPMAALLTAFEQYKSDWLVVAIDYPLISNSHIEGLMSCFANTKESYVYYNTDTNFYEPFIGVYTSAFLSTFVKEFAGQQTSLQKILQQNNVQKITVANSQVLQSIDTPEQYQAIQKLLA